LIFIGELLFSIWSSDVIEREKRNKGIPIKNQVRRDLIIIETWDEL